MRSVRPPTDRFFTHARSEKAWTQNAFPPCREVKQQQLLYTEDGDLSGRREATAQERIGRLTALHATRTFGGSFEF